MSDSDKLREMISNVELQVEAIDDSLEQINEQITELNEQISAVQNGLCFVARDALIDYLDNVKLPEFESAVSPDRLPLEIEYGEHFGTIAYTTGNIEDFSIIDNSAITIYEFEGVGWDDSTTIIAWVNDYDFGNDYLTRPPTVGTTVVIGPDGTQTIISTAQKAIWDIVNGVSEFTVILEETFQNDYYDVFASIINETDADPSIFTWVVTDRTTTTFHVKLSGVIDSANYKFSYIIGIGSSETNGNGDTPGPSDIATYGLIPNRNNLLTARNLLTNNKEKVQDSEIIFEDYAS